MNARPRVFLGRDLVDDDGKWPVEFRGEWGPDEPEGWERFVVILLGQDAGDSVTATLDDLKAIVAAYEGVSQ